MKKIYLLVIVTIFYSCSVEDDSYMEYGDLHSLTASAEENDVCAVSAGADKSTTITVAQAEAIPSWDEVRKLYLSLLEEGVSRNGEFDPSIWDLIDAFNENPLGEFTTVYTVTEGDCSDSVVLTINVAESLPVEDPTCDLSAGADASKTLTKSEADAVPSWDEVRKLYLSLLEEGVARNGEFDPSIWDIINSYTGPGSYTTTYTITDGDCSDSVELTIVVVPDGSSDPTCELSAGADASITLTQSEADAVPSWDEVRKLYLSLLEEGVARNGEFDPSIWDIINSYTGPGTYTTTYTVTEGDCVDSVELTVYVVADPPADPSCNLISVTESSKSITFSEAEAIPSWDEVRKLYLSLLPQGVSRSGSFDPSIWDLINDFNERGVGSYTTTYTLVEGECSDSIELTIFVIQD